MTKLLAAVTPCVMFVNNRQVNVVVSYVAASQVAGRRLQDWTQASAVLMLVVWLNCTPQAMMGPQLWKLRRKPEWPRLQIALAPAKGVGAKVGVLVLAISAVGDWVGDVVVVGDCVGSLVGSEVLKTIPVGDCVGCEVLNIMPVG